MKLARSPKHLNSSFSREPLGFSPSKFRKIKNEEAGNTENRRFKQRRESEGIPRRMVRELSGYLYMHVEGTQ